MEKICSTCKLQKEETEFRKWRRTCKDCERLLAKSHFHDKHNSIEAKKKRALKAKLERRSNTARFLWNSAKIRAKKYGMEFDLSKDDVVIPANCPVLGIPLFVSDKLSNNSPSLDRIDNSKGYVKGNVCVISWRANNLKSDATLEELEKICTYLKQK